MNPKDLDLISVKYNRYAFGLPQKFLDWYEANREIIRPVVYMRHAIERHDAKFRNPYRNLNCDLMPDLDIAQGEPFECWYLNDETLRKFHLKLPCYYQKDDIFKWHDDFDYVASVCFERGKYYIGTVYPRLVDNNRITNKHQYKNPKGA
jgi:hypothetical protein